MSLPPPYRSKPLKLFRVFLWLTPFPVSLLVALLSIWSLNKIGFDALIWPSLVLLPFAVCFGIGLLEGLLDTNSPKKDGRPEHWLGDALIFAVIQFLGSPILYGSLVIIASLLISKL